MTDTLLLKSFILKKGLNSEMIADRLKISRAAFSNKMNNKSEFTVSEIQGIRELLELTSIERDAIFFCEAISQNGN